MYVSQKFVEERGRTSADEGVNSMAKKDEPSVLSTLRDLLIFQMASRGVPQGQIREAVGLDMNRVSRIAKLARKSPRSEE